MRDKRVDTHVLPRRSKMRPISLAATCTITMVLNVSEREFFTYTRFLCLIFHSQTSVSTSASISPPRVADDFGDPDDSLQWVVSAYSLSSVRAMHLYL